MISRFKPCGSSGMLALLDGSFRSSTTVREKIAVISRKVTSTVKMSIIDTSSSSAGLRCRRSIFLSTWERRMRSV